MFMNWCSWVGVYGSVFMGRYRWIELGDVRQFKPRKTLTENTPPKAWILITPMISKQVSDPDTRIHE